MSTRVVCGLGGGGHLFERCTCDDRKCRRWLCIACEHIIDRSRPAALAQGEKK